MFAEILRSPSTIRATASPILRRWRTGLGNLLEEERERWLIWTPALIGLGVAIYFNLDTEPKLSSGIFLFGSIVALGFGLRHRSALARFAAILARVAAGFLAAELRTSIVSAPVLHAAVGPATVSGHVARVELLEKNARILLSDVAIQGLRREDTPAKAWRAYYDQSQAVHPAIARSTRCA
jgi:competence protein ComEC